MEQMLFGQILLNFHLISEDELHRCVVLQKHLGYPKPLGEILIEEGLLDEHVLSTILTAQQRELKTGASELGMTEHELAHRLQGADAASFMHLARDTGASNIYLTAGKRPMLRLHGKLDDLPAPALTSEKCEEMMFALLDEEQKISFERKKSLDFCVSIPDAGRFRINMFRHQDGVGSVIRVLSNELRPLDSLGLPRNVIDFTNFKNGLVLVTGSTGSGRTTTLCALVDAINKHHKRHIIMLEDPTETVLESDQSFVTQREIGTHTKNFATGLRAALREDPDVIVVGELRDAETFSTALTAAETGHLVFGTLHTRSAHGTILRVVEQFPPSQRAQIRTMLAGSLRAVICQELVPHIDGKQRCLATEVMVVNPAISNLIREDRSWQIPMVMQTSSSAGMRLMDDSLAELLRAGSITIEEAVSRANDRSRFVNPIAS